MKNIYIVLLSMLASFTTQAKERIISAGSAVTELIYALEAQQQLVAADVTSKFFIKDSDIPQVGYHRQLSAEGLLALNPTHLIGSNEMGPETTIDRLKSSQVEVVIVPSGNTVSDLYNRIDMVAQITDTKQKAAALKQKVAQQISQLESKQQQHSPKVIFLMLSKGRPATVGGSDTTIDNIISLSGANNPASQYVSSYKPVSMEAIIEMQPDYILVSERVWQSMAEEAGILKAFPLLAATPAGKAGSILPIPGHALIGGFGLESIRLSQNLAETFKQQSQL